MSLIEDARAPSEISDGRKVKGDRTRRAILTAAVNVASVEGLEGLSIGRLATELDMSKSGLFAHFGSKEELQISTVRAAAAIFGHRVDRARPRSATSPASPACRRCSTAGSTTWSTGSSPVAASSPPPRSRWTGGPGPVRDCVAQQMTRWAETLGGYARVAIERGELREETDPEQLAFELDALGTAVNSGWQLHQNEGVFERGHRAIRRRLEADATEAGRAALAAVAA